MQREQAQAGVSSKGIHFGATRPKPAQRQEGSHCGAQASITTRAFGRRGPTLVRISVLDVPLQNGQLMAPFPLNYFGEKPRASINRASHHSREAADPDLGKPREREAIELTQAVHRTSSRTPLARPFSHCTVHHQPLRQSTTPHTGVGYYTTTVAQTSINLVSLVIFIVLA